MAVYQLCITLLNIIRTGPPYDVSTGTTERQLYLQLMYNIPTLLCFPVVLITTAFLIVRLKQSLKWRGTAVNKPDNDSGKEKRVVRSVILICSMFICCFLPNLAILTVRASYPQFSLISPRLKWFVRIFYLFAFFFQTLNSSINIFIYYSMSSRYRGIFKDVFLPCRKHS